MTCIHGPGCMVCTPSETTETPALFGIDRANPPALSEGEVVRWTAELDAATRRVAQKSRPCRMPVPQFPRLTPAQRRRVRRELDALAMSCAWLELAESVGDVVRVGFRRGWEGRR